MAALALLSAGERPAAPLLHLHRAAVVPASLDDTAWFGDGIVAPTRYVFNADGTLTYTYNGNTWRNGTWKQDSAKITWECNNKFCEFEGTLDGDEITGKAWNVASYRGELKFSRTYSHYPRPIFIG